VWIRPGSARLFAQRGAVEARISADGKGLLLRTRDADATYLIA
jgi:hypothetical protein